MVRRFKHFKSPPQFQCMECGKAFKNPPRNGCPKCGGNDIDLFVPKWLQDALDEERFLETGRASACVSA
jgi:predicted  nucleic acid-binding Zn-ribbon protein